MLSTQHHGRETGRQCAGGSVLSGVRAGAPAERVAVLGRQRHLDGLDVDGEDARTELELRGAPGVTAEELAAAAAVLERWQERYGTALNAGSRTWCAQRGRARPTVGRR
jgi:hypothetical protein